MILVTVDGGLESYYGTVQRLGDALWLWSEKSREVYAATSRRGTRRPSKFANPTGEYAHSAGWKSNCFWSETMWEYRYRCYPLYVFLFSFVVARFVCNGNVLSFLVDLVRKKKAKWFFFFFLFFFRVVTKWIARLNWIFWLN